MAHLEGLGFPNPSGLPYQVVDVDSSEIFEDRQFRSSTGKPKRLTSDVFSLSDTIKPDAVKYAIWGHEALIFRPKQKPLEYEHESMVRHIVSLMEP